MKCLAHVPGSLVVCLAFVVWLPTMTGCASSPAGLDADAGSDAGVVTSPTRGDAARLEGDAGNASCGTALNGEGCPCSPGAAPRSCYVGTASQAGVGSCVYGEQACSSQGESGGAWGACSGSGAPTATCAANTCGSVSDGCGGVLDCGQCPSGEACGAGGTANQCGVGVCTPTTTCASLGFACGMAADNCGNTLDCGTCPDGQACGGSGLVNQCGCTPATCAQKGDACGSDSDGCGGTLDCGECPAGQTCGGGGAPNQCAAATVTCAPATTCTGGQNCGSEPDGCGGMVVCGTCTGADTCGGGGTAGHCGSSGGICIAMMDPECADPAVLASGQSICDGTLDTPSNGFLCSETPQFDMLSLATFYAVVCSGGSCGELQQYCWTCNDNTPADVTTQQPSAAACQDFCNGQAGTQCCGWAASSS